MASQFDDDWVSDEDIASLGLERAVHPSETNVELAERLLIESVPLAARRLVQLASDRAVNDRVALAAAQYIIDRTCGKIGEGGKGADGKDPWSGVYEAVVTDAENYANGK